MREHVIRYAEQYKVIAIVRGVESEKCISVAKALYDGGIRLMEVTYEPEKSGRMEDYGTGNR